MTSKTLQNVLGLLEGVKPNGKGYQALCPAHDDHNPSLSVAEGDDGRVLLKCFAGCSVEEIVAAVGLETRDLFERRGSERVGGSKPPASRELVDTGCTLEVYAAAKKLPSGFLKSIGAGEIANYNGHPAVRIPYLSVEGEEACVRFRLSLEGTPKVKTRRGDKVCPYGLWRLEGARERGHVVLVEGESDAHTLWHHGFPALGIPGASTWKGEWAEHLGGIEKVFVVVEPDPAGESLWERLAASPLRERLYRVGLEGFKDPSELHLDDPERFVPRFEEALREATSFMDIAETEAQERAREAWRACEGLANESRILERFAEDLKASGVAGDTRAGKLLYLALTSRLLPSEQLVNVAVKGPSSAGKSFLVEKVLGFFPKDAFHLLTAMSERALAYSEEPLAHRYLVLVEAAGMSGEFTNYLIRSLLSEGRLRYETVEKTPDGLKPRVIVREGPTGLVVTTTRTQLHPENETRMLGVRVDDGPDLTKEILAALAEEDSEPPDLERWLALQTWLAEGEHLVTIPYAKTLAREVPSVAVRLRRDFKAVLNLIRSHALLHRAARERDEKGRIAAALEDYAVVRGLVADLVSEGVEATVPKIVRETVEAAKRLLEGYGQERSVTIKQIGSELELEYQPTYRRVQMALEGGYLKNLEERERRPAKLVLGDPLPEDREILPTPEALASVFRSSGSTEGVDGPPSPLEADERERFAV